MTNFKYWKKNFTLDDFITIMSVELTNKCYYCPINTTGMPYCQPELMKHKTRKRSEMCEKIIREWADKEKVGK
jgi:hypothetical protein